MIRKNKRFKLSIILSLFIIIGTIPITIFMLTYFSIQTKKHTNFVLQRVTDNYYSEKRGHLKELVDSVKSIIRENDFSVLENARETAKARVYNAYRVTDQIYQTHKNEKTKEEIRREVISVVREIKYNNGRDSFLLIILKNPPRTDDTGKIQRILNTIRTRPEGFFSYTLPIHGTNKKNPKEVGFVKLYKPLGLAICMTVRLNEMENRVKERAIREISAIRFGKGNDNYFFIMKLQFNNDGSYYARMLLNPNKTGIKPGQIIPNNLKDAKGKLFHKEILDKCVKNGGGFVTYHFKKINSNIVEEKISYVTLYKNWDWIVGAGIYTQDLKPNLQAIKGSFSKELKRISITASLLTTFFILLLFYLLYRLSKRLQEEIYRFKGFFKEAAVSNKKIELDRIKIQEPYELALLANKMVEDKTKYEQEILNEKERLYTTIQSIADGVIATDRDGKIIIFNGVAEKLTGWNREDAIGKSIDKVFNIKNERNGEEYSDKVYRVIQEGQTITLDKHTILINKNGKKTSIEGTCAPIFDPFGKLIGGVVVFTDITEKKETEERIRQMDRLNSIGILAGGIAHDFNNILTGILGNLTLLSTIVTEKEATEYINQAKAAVKRATNLTQQLLTFARGGEPVKELTSLPNIIETSTKFILTGTSIDYHIKIPEALWDVEIDRGQFSQVIQNIVLNARHAMPKGGKIFITCRNIIPTEALNLKLPTGEQYVEIAITDEGTGISEEDINHIFDPYFTTKTNGTGLGLAICYSIIKNHGGTIRVKSELGRGTTFFIYLPATEKSANREKNREKNFELGNMSGRILVMDDDDIIRDIASTMLKKLGFEPILAKDGREAIELYREAMERGKPIRVVITDITVRGGMGGEETVKELLKIDPQVRVIVSSGYSNNPIMSNYREYGFTGVVKKPFEIEDLAEAIAKAIN